MRRTFWVTVNVRCEMLREQPDITRRLAREQLDRQASRTLFGPRGGRYEPIGPAYDYRDSAEPRWLQGEHVFAARVDARYVRPSNIRS